MRGSLTGEAASAIAGLDDPVDRRSIVIARLERIPFSRFHFHLASILAVGTFFDAFDALTIAVALTVIFTSLHIGFVNAGLLISAGYVGQFVGAWVFGYLSEVYGRKFAFIASMSLFGALSVATAFAWNFESLLVLRLVQGLGLGGEVPAAAALFNEYLRAVNRGRIGLLYQSVFIWGALLAPLIGLAVFGIFGHDLGWRVLFLLGGLPLIDAIYAIFALPESVRWLAHRGRSEEAEKILDRMEAVPRRAPLPPLMVKRQPVARKMRLGELFAPAYRNRTIVVWVQAAATFFVAYGYNIWLPTLYVRIGGLPISYALMLSVVSWIVTLTTMYAQAYLLETIGRKPLFVFGFAMIAMGGLGGAVIVMAFHATSWQILFGVQLAMGLGTAMNSSAGVSYTAELYPTRMRGWGVATATSMNRLASIISPTAVGALLAANLGIASVFAMFGVAGLIATIVMAALGVETKHRTLEELSP
jgi:MFS transporter, putative metabolite:H+ symporter